MSPDQSTAPIRRSVAARTRSAGLRLELASLALILIVAAGIRFVWIDRMPVVPESDFAMFYEMAGQIADGHWLPNSYGWVYQGPGYPTFLAPVLTFGGGLTAIRITNVVLQLGMIITVWMLGRRLVGRAAGIAAAAFATLLPGLWSYTPLVAGENLAVLLLTLVSLQLSSARSTWHNLATGLLAGGLAVARPAYLPFIAVAAVAVVVSDGRVSWRRLPWFVLGVLLIIGPICALNRANDGPLLPTGASSWQLWLVNNERSTGSWFPASAADDYPFAYLGSDAETLEAQRKLGIQFIAANPREAVSRLPARHQSNWQTDDLGIFWTMDRSPPEWQDRIPFSSSLKDWSNRLYVLTLVLAVAGAVRFRRHPRILLPLVLPLGYAVVLLAAAEGNGRYHAVVLPLLCVMAGAALAPPDGLRSRVERLRAGGAAIDLTDAPRTAWARIRNRDWGSGRASERTADVLLLVFVVLSAGLWWWGIGSRVAGLVPWSALAFWRWEQDTLPPWLILAVVLIPLAGAGLVWLPHWTTRLAISARRKPRLTWAAAALLLAIPIITLTAAISAAGRGLDQLAAVAPSGWQRAQTTPGSQPEILPLLLQDSGTNPSLREVSYPDAALLAFNPDPTPGTIVGVTRTLGALHIGTEYQFYLQVFDPGTDGDPSERLVILLNDQIVWERPPGATTPASWHYVSLPWTAQAGTVTIRVERTAGSDPAAARRATPAVRTLHLYPTY